MSQLRRHELERGSEMSEAIQEAEDICRPSTIKETELFEWAEETHRNSLGVLTDSLKQLVTISSAVLGGSAALYNLIPMSNSCKVIFFILLLGVLGISLWGGFPLTASVLFTEDIEAARERGITRRSRCLRIASALLFTAFAFLAGNLLATLSH
jgi:hypothetical protein